MSKSRSRSRSRVGSSVIRLAVGALVLFGCAASDDGHGTSPGGGSGGAGGSNGSGGFGDESIAREDDEDDEEQEAAEVEGVLALSKIASKHQVEGYASRISIVPGEELDLKVDVDAPHEVRWEAFRIGYYGGAGARRIAMGSAKRLSPQARDADGRSCRVDVESALVECKWTPSFHLTGTDAWPTGQYLIKLLRDDGYGAYVPLVVKEAKGKRAPLLFQAAVTTWQAYNSWGGAGLYRNDKSVTGSPRDLATKVSFDRPYGVDGSGGMLQWEQWMIRWLEARGYEVGYTTNIDVERDPTVLMGRQMFMTAGHDEYWTNGMRAAVDWARDSGVSLGFFSANTGYWRIRTEPSTTGEPDRIISCYKSATKDPVSSGTGPSDVSTTTTLFRNDPAPRAENALMGVMTGGQREGAAYPLVVANAAHWLYEGTGAKNGDVLGSMVGPEWDYFWPDANAPKTSEIVGHSLGVAHDGAEIQHDMLVYSPTPKSIVFATGTMRWPWALSRPGWTDRRLERVTENALRRAGLEPKSPSLLAAPASSANGSTAGHVELVAGGRVGDADGAAATAAFDGPAGVAIGEDGSVFVTEARNHRIRWIKDGVVRTVAGCGRVAFEARFSKEKGEAAPTTSAPVAGADACFNVPTGIVAANGKLLVADTGNHAIRMIDLAANTVTNYTKPAIAASGIRYVDGATAATSVFYRPRGIALGPDGALYVADQGNAALRRIEPNGGAVITVARNLHDVTGVAVGSDGAIFAFDGGAIVRITKNADDTYAAPVVLAGSVKPYGEEEAIRFRDGKGKDARLSPTEGMAVVGVDLVFTDTANGRLRKMSLAAPYDVVTLAGGSRRVHDALATGPANGASTSLWLPRGIAAGPGSGKLLVADSANSRIVQVTP